MNEQRKSNEAEERNYTRGKETHYSLTTQDVECQHAYRSFIKTLTLKKIEVLFGLPLHSFVNRRQALVCSSKMKEAHTIITQTTLLRR